MRPQGLTSVLIVILLLLPIPSLQVVQAAPVSIVNIQQVSNADAHIIQDSDENVNSDFLVVQSWSSKNMRAFISFDLEPIPLGSIVTYARLYLYMDHAPVAPRTYECDRITSPWLEDSVKWSDQPAVEGGPVTTIIGTTVGDISWDVKKWVQKFVTGDLSGAISNYGFRIKDSSEDSALVTFARFRSREDSNINRRPVLTMSYYPPHLELETYGSAFTAGNWVKLTVHRRDYDGNAVVRKDLHVKLNSTSPSPNTKFSLSSGGAAIAELVIDNGASSKDFWYYEDDAGTWSINAFAADYAQYGNDSALQIVRAGDLDHFTFTNIASPKTAGVSFPITITAVDLYGNTITDYAGTNSISDTTGTANPTMTGTFVNGIWYGNVTINKVANDVKVSTSGSGKTGNSNNFNVVAGSPVKLIISPLSFTIASGVQYSSLTISLQDANGFNATSSTAITIRLSTNSADGEFRQVGTSTKINSTAISSGSGSVKVDYYDVKGGTWTLMASATGLTAGTSVATVIPDTIPPVTTITADSTKYQSGTAIYVTNVTKFSLSATDDASGVKGTRYRIDGGSWNSYSGPFTLSLSDGSHTIGYYSTDRAKNNETEKTFTVYLDKTPPSVQAIEPIGSIISKTNTMNFRASIVETGSGIADIELFIDGTSQGIMMSEDGTYAIAKNVTAGAHSWGIRATDNLGHVTVTNNISFSLTIDTEPPMISNVVITPSSPVMGDTITVSASIADPISGVREAALFYSTDGGSTWTRVIMPEPMPTSVLYEGSIPSQGMMTKVQYYVEASDALGNAASSEVQEFTVGIPLWVYGVIVTVIVVLALAVIMRVRKPPIPPPPPPATV